MDYTTEIDTDHIEKRKQLLFVLQYMLLITHDKTLN